MLGSAAFESNGMSSASSKESRVRFDGENRVRRSVVMLANLQHLSRQKPSPADEDKIRSAR